MSNLGGKITFCKVKERNNMYSFSYETFTEYMFYGTFDLQNYSGLK